MDCRNAAIAIASDDGNVITSHFGRAPLYVVLRFKGGDVIHRETRSKVAPHVAGQEHDKAGETHAAHFAGHMAMSDSIRDCQIVIARGMGDGAYVHLTEAGLTVIMTDLHTADEVERAVKAGFLTHQPQRIHEHGRIH
jgi:predicted Fe-Mo cluster-binding NifX family protein